jgi:hypothetical protein
MEASHDVSMILWIPSIHVPLAHWSSLCVSPVFSLPKVAYVLIILPEMREMSFYTYAEKVTFRLAKFGSPWRLKLSSPAGFCHVTLIRWNRLFSPGRISARHGEVLLSCFSISLELLAIWFAFVSPGEIFRQAGFLLAMAK